ncbi:hypothetical protein DFQ27_001290, partial [Actinomortierella ambigua]
MAQGTEAAPARQQAHGRRYNRFKSVNGAKPPAPPNPLPGPVSTNDTNVPAHQFRHWQVVQQRRAARDRQTSLRAERCKQEHQQQGFNDLRSRRYGIKVHVVQPAPAVAQVVTNATPDEVEFRGFKPYPFVEPVKLQPTSTRPLQVLPARALSKDVLVKSITGFHQMTTLSVGQLGRNISHSITSAEPPQGGETSEVQKAMVEEARMATVHTIRRMVNVANDLHRHGQKCLALYIRGRTTEELHHLREALFNKKKFNTVEDAIAAAGEKRKAKSKSVDGSNDENSDAAGEEKNQEGDDAADGPADPKDEEDESGTKGDHNGFCRSLLSYLRRPNATIRADNRFIHVIRPARVNYIALSNIKDSDFEILGHGLEHTIVATLGIRLAAEFRRYFIDMAAGITTSLSYSPVRQGFMFFSENDLWSHLFRSEAIREYLHHTTGEDPDVLDLTEKPPGWLLSRLVTPVGSSMQKPGLARSHIGFARNTTTASIQELTSLRDRLASRTAGDTSSSQILMDGRQEAEKTVQGALKDNQPYNLLP